MASAVTELNNDVLHAENEALSTKVATQTSQIDDLKLENDMLQSQLQELTCKYETAMVEHSKTTTILTEHEQEMKTVLESAMDNIDQLQVAQRSIKYKEKQLAQWFETAAALDTELKKVQAVNKAYDQQFVQMRENMTKDKNRSLQLIQGWKTTYGNLEKKHIALMSTHVTATNDLQNLKHQLTALKSTNAVAKLPRPRMQDAMTSYKPTGPLGGM